MIVDSIKHALGGHRFLPVSGSFKRRLTFSSIFLSIPVLFALFLCSFIIIYSSSRQLIAQTQATTLAKYNTLLRTVVLDTENISGSILYNADIQNYMMAASENDSYPDDTSIHSWVNSLIASRDYIDSIVLIGTDKTLFSTEKAYSDRSALDNIRARWWYYDMIFGNDSFAWYPYSTLTADNYQSQQRGDIPEQTNTLMLARPIYSTSDYHTLLGYMMIYLDVEYMQNLWQEIEWGKTTNVYLMDAAGEIIYANSSFSDYSSILNDYPASPGNQFVTWHGSGYVTSCIDTDHTGWLLYMVAPYSELTLNITSLITTVFIIIFAVIILLIILARYFAGNISRPIVALSALMDKYRGKDQNLPSVSIGDYRDRADEIGRIYRSYERLEDRLNHLIQEIYVRNLEKRDAELALLQSQINPHFLYNTLDSINWLALTNGQEEISNMITALSDTFRLSLMKTNSSFIELAQEIQYIESYLMLQKFRYTKRLVYKLHGTDDLPALYIPRFILQPIVENALKHGIDKHGGSGRIDISFSVGATLRISVSNDGIDIDLEKMREILVFDPDESELLAFKNRGYGIQNIHRRIKILCGDPYGVSYEKTESKTICSVTLPVKTSA